MLMMVGVLVWLYWHMWQDVREEWKKYKAKRELRTELNKRGR
jgi:hypothetical protein